MLSDGGGDPVRNRAHVCSAEADSPEYGSEDDRGLQSAQGDKEFYIPTLEEIWKLATRGCIFDSEEAKKLRCFLVKNTDVDQDEADFICDAVQREIAADCRMEDIYQIFEDLEVDLKDDSGVNRLMELVNDLWNNTRMLLNRGFTPNELSGRAGRRKYIQMIPVRADQGKKYKNCCKNKDYKPQ